MKTLNEQKRYGVEVEFIARMDRYDLADLITQETGQRIHCVSYGDKSNKWRLKNDSSLNTFGDGGYCMELVTPK